MHHGSGLDAFMGSGLDAFMGSGLDAFMGSGLDASWVSFGSIHRVRFDQAKTIFNRFNAVGERGEHDQPPSYEEGSDLFNYP